MDDFTLEEIENCALIVIVNDRGEYKWSSGRTPEQVATMLRGIAENIEEENR